MDNSWSYICMWHYVFIILVLLQTIWNKEMTLTRRQDKVYIPVSCCVFQCSSIRHLTWLDHPNNVPLLALHHHWAHNRKSTHYSNMTLELFLLSSEEGTSNRALYTWPLNFMLPGRRRVHFFPLKCIMTLEITRSRWQKRELASSTSSSYLITSLVCTFIGSYNCIL